MVPEGDLLSVLVSVRQDQEADLRPLRRDSTYNFPRHMNTKQIENLGPLPAEHLAEYDGAAKWCAARRMNGDPDAGKIGGSLPFCMGSPGALDWIQADPEAFEERIQQCGYALTMERDEVVYALDELVHAVTTGIVHRSPEVITRARAALSKLGK